MPRAPEPTPFCGITFRFPWVVACRNYFGTGSAIWGDFQGSPTRTAICMVLPELVKGFFLSQSKGSVTPSCTPAQRVVSPSFRSKYSIFKAATFNPFQTGADMRLSEVKNPKPTPTEIGTKILSLPPVTSFFIMNKTYTMHCMGFAVLTMLLGCTSTPLATAPVSDDPFDPISSLYPEYPITEVLHVTHKPLRDSFSFGKRPQFRISLQNNSETVIDLRGETIDGVRLKPYYSLHILRKDGRNLGHGSDLKLPGDLSQIPPGETVSFDIPPSPTMGSFTSSNRRNPRALLPGTYQCYIQFWVEKDGAFQRLLSPLVPMVVMDDGSGDAQIAEAVQHATGVAEHLQLIINIDENHSINLSAKNRNAEPLYLGHDRRWRKRRLGDQTWENGRGGGIRPWGYLTVPPHGTISMGRVTFSHLETPGPYEIQAQYFDHEGNMQKESNIIILNVK